MYSIRARDANHCVTAKSITVKDEQLTALVKLHVMKLIL